MDFTVAERPTHDGDVTADVATDAALVAALLEGSEPALERLYDRHSDAVCDRRQFHD